MLRSRSAPVREFVFRSGLCLVAVWPCLALVASRLSFHSGPVASISTTIRDDEADKHLSRNALPVPAPSTSEPAIAPRSVPAATPTPVVTTAPNAVTGPSSSSSFVPPPELPVASPPAPPVEVLLQSSEPSIASSIPATNSSALNSPSIPTPTAALAPAVAVDPASGWPGQLPVLLAMALRWLVCVWAAGSLVSGYLLVRDLVRVRQLRRSLRPCGDESIATPLTEAMQLTGLRVRPDVLVSEWVGSPCTSGVLRPILILPQSMLDQSSHAFDMQLGVLTHECAHIVRRDVAWALLARVVQSVYWWEPGLRRIVRELSCLREEICDNHVLSSSIDVGLYAKALVDFAARPLFRPLVGVIGMVANDNPLSGRVERILEDSTDTTTRLRWRSRRGVASLVLVVCGVVAVIGASTKVASALSQVLLPVFEEQEVSFDSLQPGQEEVLPTTPYWSGESPRMRHVRPAAAVSTTVAASAAAPLVPQMEAGSGVSGSHSAPTDFSVPGEASSGVTTRGGVIADELLEPLDEPAVPSASGPVIADDSPFFPSLQPGVPVPEPAAAPTYMPPMETDSDDQFKKSDVRLSPALQPAFNTTLATLTVTLDEKPTVKERDLVVVGASLPESESLLPRRVRLEGLTVAMVDPHLLEPPVSDHPAPLTRPVPAYDYEVADSEQPAPEPEPAKHSLVLSGPQFKISTLAHLLARGAVLAVTKVEVQPEKDAPSTGSVTQVPVDTGGLFRMSLEAIADDMGQWTGLRCWGRELPNAAPDQRLAELNQLLSRWKKECEQVAAKGGIRLEAYTVAVTAPSGHVVNQTAYRAVTSPQPVPVTLVVRLHVSDNMRYGGVQSIVKACESHQVRVEIVSGAENIALSATSQAYTTAELTQVYDKKGQKVGDRAVLLVEKAGTPGVQVLTDSQFPQVLSAFVGRHLPSSSKLLLKVDPDLSFDSLQSFMIQANRSGFRDVIVGPQDELPLKQDDQLSPLWEEAPQPVAAPPAAPKPDELPMST
ncbi:MAG: M56 family metallopeptidase [Planctomycetaceae bacterium]